MKKSRKSARSSGFDRDPFLGGTDRWTLRILQLSAMAMLILGLVEEGTQKMRRCKRSIVDEESARPNDFAMVHERGCCGMKTSPVAALRPSVSNPDNAVQGCSNATAAARALGSAGALLISRAESVRAPLKSSSQKKKPSPTTGGAARSKSRPNQAQYPPKRVMKALLVGRRVSGR